MKSEPHVNVPYTSLYIYICQQVKTVTFGLHVMTWWKEGKHLPQTIAAAMLGHGGSDGSPVLTPGQKAAEAAGELLIHTACRPA